MVKCEQMGWVRSGGGSDDTCNLPFHKTALLFVIWISQTSPGAAKGNKEYLAVYMGERLAFPSKTSDRDAF